MATALLALIIFTGAAVRLTDSGLGCEDWPTCNDSDLVPANDLHGWIEFGNRMLSGVVALAVMAAVLSAKRLDPRRPDLERLAWGLVAGVAFQIVLGGITVKLDLNPLIVAVHFLVSAVLMANALVLHWRAGADPGPTTVAAATVPHAKVQTALAGLVLAVGTLVTGSGPNSGDIRADRFGFDLQTIARIHSATAWIFVASLVYLAVRIQSAQRAPGAVLIRVRALMTVAVLQGALGYWQYNRGVPPLLVELHVVGAVALWCTTLWLLLAHFALPSRATSSGTSPTVQDGDALKIRQT